MNHNDFKQRIQNLADTLDSAADNSREVAATSEFCNTPDAILTDIEQTVTKVASQAETLHEQYAVEDEFDDYFEDEEDNLDKDVGKEHQDE
jgi:hypothetical protein